MYERSSAHAMTTTNGHAFNNWLRVQLKARQISQRLLAQRSGVDHSTISRIIRLDRVPSVGTATKLARGLGALGSEADTQRDLPQVLPSATHPTARVEHALRADDWLSEAQVRQVMEYYLAVRTGRPGRPAAGRAATARVSRQPQPIAGVRAEMVNLSARRAP
jgi:transcriptional regulator with XRE-family HTH domain